MLFIPYLFGEVVCQKGKTEKTAFCLSVRIVLIPLQENFIKKGDERIGNIENEIKHQRMLSDI